MWIEKRRLFLGLGLLLFGLLAIPFISIKHTSKAASVISSGTDFVRSRLSSQAPSPTSELLNINALPLDLNASSLDTRSSHLVTKIWDKLQAPVTKKLQHDAEDYALTRELVKAHARNGTIIAAMSNAGHLDFVLNWVAHLWALNVTSFLIGALDEDMLWELVDREIPAFSLSAGLDKGDWGWGGTAFIAAGRSRQKIMEVISGFGFNVLMSDVDLVWVQDPLPYVAQWPAADMLVSSDSVATTSEDGGLESASSFLLANVGVVLARPPALPLLKEWGEKMTADEKLWEQAAFNDLVHRGGDVLSDDHPDLFMGYDRKLKIGTLPVSLFCNGHTNFVQHMPETLGLKPFSLHAIYQYSAEAGKRHRFRESHIWNDPPEYYDPPGGFLAFDVDVKDLLLTAAPATSSKQLDNFDGHFRLVNHQLKAVRHAMAVASALGRVLIMPPMWCGADRWWAPHNGRIPPSRFDLPFICPLDHVLDLEVMQKKRADIIFGPHIHFREYSLLDNPRMPASIKDDELLVGICQADSAQASEDCTLSGSPSPGSPPPEQILLPGNATDAELVEQLKPYASRKILRFQDVVGTFRGHALPEDAERFERRVKEYTSLWCCVEQQPIGHVWYDMWWDKIPHHDKHYRLIDSSWHPLLGP